MKTRLTLKTLTQALAAILLATSLLSVTPAVAAPADDFVITVRTNNPGTSSNIQFTIPTTGSGYNYNVDCDNDSTDDATAQTGNYTCNYAAAGTYTVRIKDNSGARTGFPRIYFNNTGDRQKLLTIEQWGTGRWTSMNGAFFGCSNLTYNATGVPDLSLVTDMGNMFSGASVFNGAIGGWNTASVTNMNNMFENASAFNGDISGWDTTNVTNMSWMFQNASAFNQDISGWNTANVTNMSGMFSGASVFDRAIGGIGDWDTTSVTNMSYMFQNASAFNGDISTWNTANVTNMSWMFQNASAFNQAIGGWITSGVTNMSGMFSGASVFNQAIGGWTTSGVTNMSCMFQNASAFNQAIGGWNTANVTDMSWMFQNASGFNGDISGWTTTSVTNMSGMFYGASVFNQAISGWTTSGVTNMSYMFQNASAFNQAIGGWNTASVTNMSGMFQNASAFNQAIGGWNTANVMNMSWMFQNASAFNQAIGGWNVAELTTAASMFSGAHLSTANYDALLMGWDAQTLQSGVSFHGGNSTYCIGEVARANMSSSDSWLITDGGRGCGVVWDGGGTDNNWSTGLNWVGDAVPAATDNVVFNGTSSKDAVIDVAFGGTVGGVIITDLYGGTISHGRSLAVSGYYNQDGGTVSVDPAHAFTVGGNFNHTGGVIRQTRNVNNANVAFLQISDGGSNVKYRGVEVDTTADLGAMTVSIRAVDTGAGEYCTDTGGSSPAYARRCFDITSTNVGAGRVRLWALTSELNGIPESNLSVYRHTGPSTWTELTTNRVTGNDGGSYNYAEGDTPGFSAFLLGQMGISPTSIHLQSFTAEAAPQFLGATVFLGAAVTALSGLFLWRRRKAG